jgi:hypothetical protein
MFATLNMQIFSYFLGYILGRDSNCYFLFMLTISINIMNKPGQRENSDDGRRGENWRKRKMKRRQVLHCMVKKS